VPKTDKGIADEKLLAAGKSSKPGSRELKDSPKPSATPAMLQAGFKVDKSAAARALSKAYAMTQKRLHGDK
jgi:hypothetical protein